MADTPDNEALSQDEIDALTETSNSDDSSPAPEEPAEIAADATEDRVDDLEAVGEEIDPSAFEMQDSDPVAATLKMESFTDHPAKPLSALHSFERIEDVPLDLTVELGRTKLLIKDVLDLGAGSIVELEKMAGEPVDLLANGLLIARGEVVVIDDNFGVRITEVITSAERKALSEDMADLNAA
jgi:flagellar motor switch protein FliN